MTNEQQEVTPEQYKQRLLKQNFASRCADYEDVIATLQTENQILKQQLQQLQDTKDEDLGLDDLELDGGEEETLAPPPPPTE